jgi:hypothetical protein
VLGGYARYQRQRQDPTWEPEEDDDRYMFVTSKRGRHKKLEGAMRYNFNRDYDGVEYSHINFLSSSPRNEKGMPNRLNGTGKRLIYKLARQLVKSYEGSGSEGKSPYIQLSYLSGALPFYERKIGFKHTDNGFTLDYDGMKRFINTIRKDDKKGSPFFRKDADDWDNWFDDEDEPDGDIARGPIKKDKIMKEFGAVGDVSVPTFNGSAGQNYKKKIGSALHFKAKGVEGVFDVMKSVKFEDIHE